MTPPADIGAVVFDMDGVLFDTEPLYDEAAVLACADLGVQMPRTLASRRIGLSWTGTRRLLLEEFGPSYPVDAFVSAWMAHFDGLSRIGLKTKPGVREILATLDALRIPCAIATGATRSAVRRHLSSHGLGDSFAAVVAHEDIAEGKPAPDPFLEAARRVAVAPARCLAVEDSLNGVRSAAAAGMMTVMVPDLVAPTAEARRLCVLVACDLHEVARRFFKAER